VEQTLSEAQEIQRFIPTRAMIEEVFLKLLIQLVVTLQNWYKGEKEVVL
jgi:hypothetical protein